MNQVFYNGVSSLIQKENILLKEPMKRHTTFRIGGEADFYLKPNGIEEMAKLIKYCNSINMEYCIIGNGSNLLVGDEGYRGAIIQVFDNKNHLRIEGKKIIAGAGALLSQIANFAWENELTGMEFAAGIPGTIGGAVVMNAGAYGSEMKEIVTKVEAVTGNGEIIFLTEEELGFGYRMSIFKKRPLIAMEVTLELEKGEKSMIKARMNELKEKRVKSQPLEFPSAGSVFKRPEGYYAGKLIMDAGLRGFRVGGAMVSKKHCGFIINVGDASAKDVKDLIGEIQDRVREKFGVMLEPEVCMIGEF
ncbi:UDP-N-acetylmuramate dehydrogenase [bacterium 1XD42-8]|jgi:UDP-N-acetylmuramate dehydrogenase|nr:UDP-N-acetylmuramate dehydrogenase [Lachnospiraceae bacterium]RKJ39651.1 UDP-N-acetylmuramate dehydrogenase [bacterium 1XD42-8]